MIAVIISFGVLFSRDLKDGQRVRSQTLPRNAGSRARERRPRTTPASVSSRMRFAFRTEAPRGARCPQPRHAARCKAATARNLQANISGDRVTWSEETGNGQASRNLHYFVRAEEGAREQREWRVAS